MKIEGFDKEYGISVDLPDSWEGRIWAPGYPSLDAVPGPALHAGSFELPADDGTLGNAACRIMTTSDVFFAFTGVGRELANVGIYAQNGLDSPLSPSDFNPTASFDPVVGISFVERFLTVGTWAFVLFVACGTLALTESGLDQLRAVLATVTVQSTSVPAAP
jgi:hypothetical protein